ncbi:MAG: hypothetical protein SOR93_03485 [Clostridiales Family XIII bacterium]|uniref:distal tail protein Dit n=1 Tax=Hominibacterium faecale TaxID=2839743 RepID=UPI0022B29D97|nr:distal tail protein Dit [Hominibacterium faecale]MCI7301832.1 phage tail protein [Clostridia bacterium]MDY3010309.1 hypothetical protein [Clostridiales Family XIII bacterium]
MYDITFKGKTGYHNGVLVVKRPNIPAPERNVEYIEIPGRDGAITQDQKTYKNIEISIELNFMAKETEWQQCFRKCKNWLQGAGKLELSDDAQFYYRVKNVSLSENERTSLEIGKFTATFVCDPYMYLKSGMRERAIEEVTYNPYDLSCPIYMIEGEGICAIDVNGKTLAINVGQNAVIDTDLMIAYRKDGTLINAQVYGYYEDGRLKPGDISLYASDGFNVKIIPNWRCL